MRRFHWNPVRNPRQKLGIWAIQGLGGAGLWAGAGSVLEGPHAPVSQRLVSNVCWKIADVPGELDRKPVQCWSVLAYNHSAGHIADKGMLRLLLLTTI